MREDRPAVETASPADGGREPVGVRAPPVVRNAARITLALMLAGAGYLIAVRRDAILVDLANFAAWCL